MDAAESFESFEFLHGERPHTDRALVIVTQQPHAANPSVTTLLSDPSWLPMHLDTATSQMEMIRVDRATRRAVTFLDEEYLQDQEFRATMPLGVACRTAPTANDMHFIFHSAFACSTLLARALDIPGVSASLSEPAILNELSHQARAGRSDRAMLAGTLALLGRGFAANETVVVKPSNVVNNLIDDLLALRPKAKALLLYKPLPDFLLSVAAKGMFGRIWARRCFALLRGDGWFEAGFSEAETFGQTDLQIAAALWLAHHRQFADLVRRYPGRVRTLDSASFLSRKTDCLGAIGGLFGMKFDPAHLAAGPAFAGDAKQVGRAFRPDDRAIDIAAQRAAHGEEINMVATWAEKVAEFLGVPMDPGASLLA